MYIKGTVCCLYSVVVLGLNACMMVLFVVFGFSYFLRWSGIASSKRMSQSQTAKGVDFESDEVIVTSFMKCKWRQLVRHPDYLAVACNAKSQRVPSV